MIKYATALRLRTAETEQVLRRFMKGGGPRHPVYLALEELGPEVWVALLAEFAAELRHLEPGAPGGDALPVAELDDTGALWVPRLGGRRPAGRAAGRLHSGTPAFHGRDRGVPQAE